METNFQFFFQFVGRKTWNFIAAVRKWEMLAATKVNMGGSEEQVNRNKHSISSIKRVTGKCHVLVTQKKVYCRSKVFLANYTIFVAVFLPISLSSLFL